MFAWFRYDQHVEFSIYTRAMRMDLSSWSSRGCSSMVSVVNETENDTWTHGDNLYLTCLLCALVRCQVENLSNKHKNTLQTKRWLYSHLKKRMHCYLLSNQFRVSIILIIFVPCKLPSYFLSSKPLGITYIQCKFYYYCTVCYTRRRKAVAIVFA